MDKVDTTKCIVVYAFSSAECVSCSGDLSIIFNASGLGPSNNFVVLMPPMRQKKFEINLYRINLIKDSVTVHTDLMSFRKADSLGKDGNHASKGGVLMINPAGKWINIKLGQPLNREDIQRKASKLCLTH